MKPVLRTLGVVCLAIVAVTCTADSPTTPAHAPLAASTPAAAKVVDQPSGTLSLCKQAGAGLPAGQLFTFRVTLSGVIRNVVVAAGSCVAVEIPRERAPLSKGHYKSNPQAVARLLPGGATLLVDDAALTSAQLQAILGPATTVTASSSLLLNLAQQLVAADLNVLRGVQPSAAVQQAIADADAGIHITGAGANLQITTTLSASSLSALVDALSAFNSGKTKPAAPPATADVQIAELAGSLTTVTAIACDPALRCANADVAAGTVTATVASGATTTVTYTNKAQPVLEVCKVAGAGITAGTVFRISAVALGLNSGTTVFDVPAGECREAVLAPGSYLLQETIPAGTAVSAISCTPAGACGAPFVSDGVVGASVSDAETTTVTYTNRSTQGTLRVCKVAGAGIEAGTEFRVGAALVGLGSGSASFDVPAGECRDATVTEGSWILQETIVAGTAVSAITCEPAGICGTPILADGVVTTTVAAQSMTTVTYTNRSTLGTLEVCKVAGPGITPGTEFHMGATLLGLGSGSAGFDVPAGECREAAVTEGTYIVQETIPSGVAVTAIGCSPSASCGTPLVADGVVTLTVQAQSKVTVTYTNSAAP